MLIEWKEEYSVGVEKLDEQHQGIIAIINRLAELIGKSRNFEDVGALIDDLKKQSIEHFDLEEKYFDEFNFEFTEEHKKTHKEFLEKVSGLRSEYNTDEVGASFKLVDCLEDWFLEHMTTDDQKYVELFKSHNLS